jgi:hypothetical protein
LCGFKVIEIPASVKGIGSDAFQICCGITRVAFAPGSRLRVLNGFMGLKIETVVIPARVKEIGDGTLKMSLFLKRVTFESGLRLWVINGLVSLGWRRVRSLHPWNNNTIIIHLLGLAPAGYLAAPDNGP